jgi:hypothetical protein
MTIESEKNSESAHAGSLHAERGPDAEQAALANVERAREEIAHAKDEMVHAIRDLDQGEEHLTKAEAEFDLAKHHVIRFFVDGEENETREPKQTPNHIIREYGRRDPINHYLVEIDGGKKISYQGKGEETILIHDCARFQVISVGPTPVSDGTIRTGVELFISGLISLGFEPKQVPGKTSNVYFRYPVETGKFAGKTVLLGFGVPADFPLTSPAGPHVAPHIHPINPNGSHPTGAVHLSSEFAGIGPDPWQYWSRPHKRWGETKKTVATYMSHIWKLWDSQ